MVLLPQICPLWGVQGFAELNPLSWILHWWVSWSCKVGDMTGSLSSPSLSRSPRFFFSPYFYSLLSPLYCPFYLVWRSGSFFLCFFLYIKVVSGAKCQTGYRDCLAPGVLGHHFIHISVSYACNGFLLCWPFHVHVSFSTCLCWCICTNCVLP